MSINGKFTSKRWFAHEGKGVDSYIQLVHLRLISFDVYKFYVKKKL